MPVWAALARAGADMTDADRLAEALTFIAEFASEKFPAEPKPFVRHPEDEPDAVTDAETVWAWQEDAKALWRKLK